MKFFILYKCRYLHVLEGFMSEAPTWRPQATTTLIEIKGHDGG